MRYNYHNNLHNKIFIICICSLFAIINTLAIVYNTKRTKILLENGFWREFLEEPHQHQQLSEENLNNINNNNNNNNNVDINLSYELSMATGFSNGNETISFNYLAGSGGGDDGFSDNGAEMDINNGAELNSAVAIDDILHNDEVTNSNSSASNADDDNIINMFKKRRKKREVIVRDDMGNRVYNVGVLMASHLGKWQYMLYVLHLKKYC